MDSLVVDTPFGTVRGRRHGATRRFLGVPYAAPPVGPLRWRPPAPVEPWSGVRDATKPPEPASQILPVVDLALGQEDCLYLNVVVPAEPASTSLPVMVWIHGGGFTVGSANDDDPTRLVERGDVVVVSINYRLGPFGFLAHPVLEAEDPHDAGTGNLGFLDQVAALEWVQGAIACFGGAPDTVTIFGESAGGVSVYDHLVSPRSSGLFHRAIVQSGPLRLGVDPELARRQGSELAAVLGCAARPDPIAAMRDVDAADVLAALPPDSTFVFGRGATWTPVADGVVLPADVPAALREGDFAQVPVLAGITRDEGRLFVGMAAHSVGARMDPVTEARYADTVVGYFGESVGPLVVDAYPPRDFPDPGAAFGQALGDAFLAVGAVDGAVSMAAHVPVHLYQYEHAPNPFVLPMPGIDLGAFHAAELPYVFGGPVLSSGPFTFSEAEQELSCTVMDAWARFARTGDPAGASLTWPRLDASGKYLALDTPVGVGSDLKRTERDFWNATGWQLADANRDLASMPGR